MRPEIAILKQVTMRGRMAFALVCLERLADKFKYSSPKYQELLNLLWEFTGTAQFLTWNQKLSVPQWGNVRSLGFWLINTENRSKPAYNSEPFPDIPEALAGMLGLCAAIGEAHLYGAFQSEDSEHYLEKVLNLMDEQRVEIPPLEKFLENKLNFVSNPDGDGFRAPRTFYTGY